jgi:hypothetical protein
MQQTIRINDEGTTIRGTIYDETDTVVDISTATVKQFRLRKPDKTFVSKTATFSAGGTDGRIQYTLVAGDIDQAGRWEIEAYVEMPSGKWYSQTNEFFVN